MANNVQVTAGAGTTFKTTDNAGVHTGHTNVDTVVPGTAATSLGKAEDAAHTSGDVGVMALAVRQDTAAALATTDADYCPLIVDSTGRLHVALSAIAYGSGVNGSTVQRVALATDSAGISTGLSNRAISAAFTTLTRPANTTAYTALDSISDNATAGSVTALSASLSDTNDHPIFLSEILVHSTDTGLAGKRIRAYVYNSDPTASSGVVAGDNVAFSNKKAGYIGSFSGVMETGFSDGTPGRLVPTFADGAAASTPHAMAGGFVVTVPTSGAKTLFIQYQAVDGFTPSANSTTIIGTARGWQGRAA